MIKLYIFSLVIFLWVSVTSCNQYKNKPFAIEELEFLNRFYTLSDNSKSFNRFFIIKGFRYNDDLQDSLIDNYVCSLMDSLSFQNTVLAFYKESKYTNKEYLLKYPKEIYRESSEDVLISYHYKNNYFDHKFKLLLNPDKTINTKVIRKLKCSKS